jgi:hypothetical protein
MAKAKKLKQLTFAMKNKVGQLDAVTTVLKDARVNIKAICAYGMGKKAYFMVVTNNNNRAKRALSKLRLKAKEENIIAVEMPNRIGQLKNAATKIAQSGIDINYMYGTVGTGKTSVCVFSTANDTKALKALK